MLKPKDAITLAWAKFVSHKIWNSLFVSVEVVLLSLVLLASSCSIGFISSLEQFNSQGLNGKFLVTAANVRANPDLINDPATWDLAEELYQKYTTEHAQLATKIGINYNKDSEPAPTEYIDGKRTFNAYTKYAQMAIDQRMQGYLEANQADLEKLLQGYNYQKIYPNEVFGTNGAFALLNDNKEDLADYQNTGDELFYGIHVLDKELYRYYLFDKADTLTTDAIPVVMSLKQMENHLGLEPLANNANDKEKLNRLAEVRDKSDHLLIETCYRNEASKQLLFEAQRINDEIRRGEGQEYYVEPELIYELPQTACGEVTVKKDNRSVEAKRYADLLTEYRKALGEYEEPAQKLVQFQVIGIIPTADPTKRADNILEMIQSLGGVSIGTPLLTREYYQAHQAELEQIFIAPNPSTDYYGLNQQFIIEFTNAEQARDFIAAKSCTIRGSLNNGCATEDKPFLLQADSNNSLVISDITKTLATVILIIITVVLAITVIMMFISVLRSITSDAREIAIFRALGFRREQIIWIYLTYALLMAVGIVILSTILSLIIGYILEPWLANLATDFLRASFLNIDADLSAQIFTPDLWVYLGLSGTIIIASLIAAFLPTIIKTQQSIVDGLRENV